MISNRKYELVLVLSGFLIHVPFTEFAIFAVESALHHQSCSRAADHCTFVFMCKIIYGNKLRKQSEIIVFTTKHIGLFNEYKLSNVVHVVNNLRLLK